MDSQSILMDENDETLGLDSLPEPRHPFKILRMVDSLFLCEPEWPFHLNGQPFPPLRSPPL